MDHYNYARWLSVQVQDLLSLPITRPQLHQEVERGNFVVQILGSQFSQIYYYQAHEQRNKTIKFIIGPIDLVIRVSDEFQREISGHKTFEYLEQAEGKMLKVKEKNETCHHEDSSTHNNIFRED